MALRAYIESQKMENSQRLSSVKEAREDNTRAKNRERGAKASIPSIKCETT